MQGCEGMAKMTATRTQDFGYILGLGNGEREATRMTYELLDRSIPQLPTNICSRY